MRSSRNTVVYSFIKMPATNGVAILSLQFDDNFNSNIEKGSFWKIDYNNNFSKRIRIPGGSWSSQGNWIV